MSIDDIMYPPAGQVNRTDVARVSWAIDVIASGGMVVVVDADSRENEADLIA